MRFERGKRVSFTKGKCSEKGTTITFKPDKEIFKETISLDYKKLKEQIKELAYLSPKLIFTLQFEDKPIETITSENGIQDYITDLNKEKNTITSVFYAETLENRIGVKIAMQYNDSYSDVYKIYTNSVPNNGGTHLTGFRSALTKQINDYARKHKLLKDKESNLSSDELKEGLTLVLSFFMPDPVFSGQTKDVLTSSEGRTIVQHLVSDKLYFWLESNPKDAKTIIEKALLARKARERAKKAKEAVRKLDNKGNKTINLPTKLVDAWGKDRSKCELLISEGDSAAGGLVSARNAQYQAVFPIRGKIISSKKQSKAKIFSNQEVINIIKAIGLDVNPKTHKLIYNPSKLRYGKIIFCVDAEMSAVIPFPFISGVVKTANGEA